MTLLHRLETCAADQQADLLNEVFDLIFPVPYANQACDHTLEWEMLCDRFAKPMNAGCYIDAAVLIFQEALPGWNYGLGFRGGDAFAMVSPTDMPGEIGRATTPALALCAAIVRAKGIET
jgi:hypothetical protein